MLAHQDYWLPQLNAGLVLAMGPVADPNGDYGVMLANVPSLKMLEDWQAKDPAILSRARFRVQKLSRCRRSALRRSSRSRRSPRFPRRGLQTEGRRSRRDAHGHRNPCSHPRRVDLRGHRRQMVQAARRLGEGGRAFGRTRNREGDAGGQLARGGRPVRDRRRFRRDRRDRRAARFAERGARPARRSLRLKADASGPQVCAGASAFRHAARALGRQNGGRKQYRPWRGRRQRQARASAQGRRDRRARQARAACPGARRRLRPRPPPRPSALHPSRTTLRARSACV